MSIKSLKPNYEMFICKTYVYAPSFPFPGLPSAADLDPKVVFNSTKILSNLLVNQIG